MENNNPIISQLQKHKTDPIIVGRGHEVEMGKKVYGFQAESASGESIPFIEKPMRYERAAKETLAMWQKMKELGLPVVEFLKIIKKRDQQSNEDKFTIAMEDLTDHGNNLVVPAGKHYVDGSFNLTDTGVNVFSGAQNIDEVKKSMAKALAVLHKNNIYEFHDNLSFVLVARKADVKKGNFTVRFCIIDYSNFSHAELDSNTDLAEKRKQYSGGVNFDNGSKRNVRKLAEAGVDENDYNTYLKEGVTYN